MEEEFIISPGKKTKPKQVVFGGAFLYVAYVLEMGCRWLSGTDMLAFLTALFLGGYFVFSVNEGKNWARIVILIIVILNTIAIPFSIRYFINEGNPDRREIILLVLSGLFYIVAVIALILLFTKPANAWFKKEEQI